MEKDWRKTNKINLEELLDDITRLLALLSALSEYMPTLALLIVPAELEIRTMTASDIARICKTRSDIPKKIMLALGYLMVAQQKKNMVLYETTSNMEHIYRLYRLIRNTPGLRKSYTTYRTIYLAKLRSGIKLAKLAKKRADKKKNSNKNEQHGHRC